MFLLPVDASGNQELKRERSQHRICAIPMWNAAPLARQALPCKGLTDSEM